MAAKKNTTKTKIKVPKGNQKKKKSKITEPPKKPEGHSKIYESLKGKDHLTSQEKTKWRQSPEWKWLRLSILYERGKKCEICGMPCPSPTIHHVYDSGDYKSLDKSRYKVLCNQCHRFGHLILHKKRRTKFVEMLQKIFIEAGFGEEWRSED